MKSIMHINRQLTSALANVFFLFLIFTQSANALTIEPLNTGGGCCSSSTRGYWFQANQDFNITSIFFSGNPSVTNSTLEVIKLNNPPPVFNSFTNDFTSLGYWTNVPSVNTNLNFTVGDIIGVLGWHDGSTPYHQGSLNTPLGTLQRLGFQSLGQAKDVWTEGPSTNNIGAIAFNYELGNQNTVPEPATIALLGLGFAGMAARRRKSV
jgi:hypothetical protein